MTLLYADKIEVKAQGRSAPILHKTTLQFNKGQFVVVLGANGSGKSTLVKALAGDIKPSSGAIFIDGTKISEMHEQTKAQEIVSLGQKAEDRLFLDLTLEENAILWESRFERAKQLSFEQIIKRAHRKERFTLLRKQRAAKLSGGEKQSILLALAITHPPKILFLDEHTASLDPKASRDIMIATNRAIIDNNITAIMVTHNLEDALSYGNRLIVMNEGRVVIDQDKSQNLSKHELKEMMEMS